MRVSHIITRLIVGGAQENTLASVLGLRLKPSLSVDLLAGPTTGPEGSLQHHALSVPGLLTLCPNLVRPVHPWKDMLAFQDLTRWLQAHKPDIVHTHSGKAGVLGRLAAARARVPIIVHTIHGPSFGPFQGSTANLIFRAAERHAATVTTHFVTVADAMRSQYLAAGIGNPSQYTTIWSGFDLDPFLAAKNDPALRARLGFGPGDIIIGKIARLSPLKGHDDLLAIAPELLRTDPRIKFLLVGDGLLRPNFEARVRDLGLTRHFRFTGLLDPAAVPPVIGIMDLLLHLSRREGLPRALPQAMAAAKPVIACDCDGAREVCLERLTGFLIPPGDLQNLRDRILQLARDPALRQQLGERGQHLVRDRFPVQKMVDALHTLYLRLQPAKSVS